MTDGVAPEYRGLPWLETLILVTLLTGLLVPQPSRAGSAVFPADPENCLSCHRFRGLSRLDPASGELRLFFCSSRYYSERQGPHAKLACTDCHPRDEVSVIPHREVTPVSCGQTCHLTSASGAAVRFSHASVSERLEGSVHSDEHFAELAFDTPPLRPGQSSCLYCHDQPIYRDLTTDDTSQRGCDPTTRCATCHGEELPVDTAYYVRHAASRLQPARPVRETAQVCAVCHSDPALVEQMGHHDAVASYFHSFHGKASLLGSQETARCVDCHGSETGDVHMMLSAADPSSPTHADSLPTTCRTAQCHPGAAPGLSSAAVHMDIDPRARTPEYYVVVAFVLLTAGVMSVYFALVLLELLNVVVRRENDEHRRLVGLARAVRAHPEGRRRLTRLSVHQRAQHWLLAIFFILLVATGMPIKFATDPLMQQLVGLFGGLSGARVVHRVSGLILCAVFAYHLGYLAFHLAHAVWSKHRAGTGASLIKLLAVTVYDSPMMVRPEDVRHFAQLFAYLLGLRKHRPAHGVFHFSQKFEYWAVFWGMVIIGTSGIILWIAPWFSQFVDGRALNFAIIVHSDEAFLAFIYIAVVHFFAVIVSPSVFPLSTGSLDGMLPAEEVAESHAGHLQAVADELGIEGIPAQPRRGLNALLRQILRRTYAAAMLLLVGWVCFVSLSFLVRLVTSGEHAPEEVLGIPTRLEEADLVTGPGSHEGTSESADALHRESTHRRGPLAHFHVIPGWYTPDPANSCTTAGCHVALPHGNRKEDRAFLNMHTTFADCQVCHLQATAADVQWVSLDRRSRHDAPAVLQLASYLEEPEPQTTAGWRALDRELRGLLADAVGESDGDEVLERWLLQLQTTNVDGELYRSRVDEVRRGIALHVHGEYGVKLGFAAGTARAWAPDDEQQRAARTLSGSESTLGEEARQDAIDVLHRDLERPGAGCEACHAQQPVRVDFGALGYSQQRSDALRSNAIVRQLGTMDSGESFYLPAILEGSAPAGDDDSAAELQP